MARELKDFNTFPGRIVPEKGWYEFPKLYKRDKKKNIKCWQMIVRLVKISPELENHRGQNWNIMDDVQVPIVPDFVTGDHLPKKTVAQFWAETSISGGETSRFPPDYANVANAGRANERNALQTAMIKARDKFIHMQRKGYVDSVRAAKRAAKTTRNVLTYPMLALKFREHRDSVEYPAIVQPKLDGVHFLAFLKVGDAKVDSPDVATAGDVVIYSRASKDFAGFTHIREQLLPILVDLYDRTTNESIYLDGEIYNHGMVLQEITSIARNVSKNEDPEDNRVDMWLFDCFYPSQTDMPFNVRYAILERLFTGNTVLKRYKFVRENVDKILVSTLKMLTLEEKLDSHNYREYNNLEEAKEVTQYVSTANPPMVVAKRLGYLVLVPCIQVASFEELQLYYYYMLSVKFEGIMIRAADSPYITNLESDDSRRSPHLLKHKPTYTAEYRVVGFTQGKSTNAKALIWVCKIGSNKFNVTPKNTTLSARRQLYADLIDNDDLFDEKYAGRMLTVEYEELSKADVPLRAKSIGFRDIE